MKNVSRPWL